MVLMAVIDSLPDNIVDCWRGVRNRPLTCSTIFPEVVHLKLSGDDAGMAAAIELMDPFQGADNLYIHESASIMWPEAA
jgi:hypothetical protein